MVGLLIVTLLTTLLSEEALFSWAWRVPFLLALPLDVVSTRIKAWIEQKAPANRSSRSALAP